LFCATSRPDAFPPDIHIFTSTKQPWVRLSGDVPVVPEYCRSAERRPAAALERRAALFPPK
jgi:hypothetical protein